jgi:4-amino-4-deoxy-L-arabinose transferase-like glycosyltransferase
MQHTPPTTRPAATPDHRRAISTLLATLLACVVLLPLLGHKPLTNWDEGIYAEVSREMLSGNAFVPHWNYQPWFEKPPLMLWITAIFFKLFGVTDFWARAGSALSGVAIVALLHHWLIRQKDTLAAWISTLLLLGTFGFLHVCRVGETDVLLSLGCCIALCGLTAVQQHNLKGWYLLWAGLAIAIMTKGAASLVLILTIPAFIAVEVAAERTIDRRNAIRIGKHFWQGLAFFLFAVLPWHLYMFHLYGAAFVSEYLGFHVLTRATHQIENHITHWWFYLWVILISAAPFALLYPFALFDGLRRRQLRAWSIFAIITIVLFSIAQTRLPHYIAPAYPALALLTAVYLADKLRQLQHRRPQSPTTFWTATAVAALLISIASALLTAHPRSHLHETRVGPNIVSAEKESIQLLRTVSRQSQPVSGPLLVWWEGDARSIATSVFYSHRPVQQVQPQPIPPNTPTDKYLFQPQTFDAAVTSTPSLILLDTYLVPQIPANFAYHRILAGRSMEVGYIARR